MKTELLISDWKMSYEVKEQGIVKKSEMKDIFSNGGAYNQPRVSENAYIISNVNRGVNSCEMVPGSLMKAFSGQYNLTQTLVVQVDISFISYTICNFM